MVPFAARNYGLTREWNFKSLLSPRRLQQVIISSEWSRQKFSTWAKTWKCINKRESKGSVSLRFGGWKPATSQFIFGLIFVKKFRWLRQTWAYVLCYCCAVDVIIRVCQASNRSYSCPQTILLSITVDPHALSTQISPSVSTRCQLIQFQTLREELRF